MYLTQDLIGKSFLHYEKGNHSDIMVYADDVIYGYDWLKL